MLILKEVRLSRSGFIAIPLLTLVIFGGVLTYLLYQKQNSVDVLTDQVVKLSEEYKQSSGLVAEQKLEKLIEVSSKRKELLVKKIEDNPQEFLEQANLADRRDELPKEIQPLVEQRVNTEGLFSLIHIDSFDAKKSEFDYLLTQTDSQTKLERAAYELHFASGEPEITTGSDVKVKGGVELDKQVVLANASNSGSNTLEVVSLVAPTSSIGDQKTLAILVNFNDNPGNKPFTTDSIKSKLLSDDPNSNNTYYKENSFNKVSFSGEVVGWYSIPFYGCNYYDWAYDAQVAARNTGINISSYQRFVYVFPTTNGCYPGVGGLGEVGSANYVNTYAWIFGESDVRIYEHELGHNLGSHHANLASCQTANDFTNCTNEEYGDIYDVMGNFWWVGNNAHHFNGPHKVGMGWVPSSNIQTATAQGTYTLAPIETLGTKPQILKIHKNDKNEDYYVSYRQKSGFDKNLPDFLVNGASIHIWKGTYYKQTKWISTPQMNTLKDGQTLYDSVNKLWIKQLSHNADGVTVEVGFGFLEGIGLEVNVSSVDVIVEAGSTVKVFDLKSTGAKGFSLYGYPVEQSGISWSVQSGGIQSGQSIPISIKIGNNVPSGTYTGTGIIKNDTGQQMTIPIKITIPAPLKINSINPLQAEIGRAITISGTGLFPSGVGAPVAGGGGGGRSVVLVRNSDNTETVLYQPSSSGPAGGGGGGEYWNDTSISFLLPATAPQIGKIKVNNGLTSTTFSQDFTVISQPSADSRRVFVTSTRYRPNFGGLTGAAAKCQERADVGKLGGIWEAWLSDSITSASERLEQFNGPYKRLDNKIVANNWLDLTDGSLQNPISMTELGIQQSHSSVWTNTLANGNKGENSCDNWTSISDTLKGNTGGADSFKYKYWTEGGYGRCDAGFDNLYCFEQNPNPPTPTPTPSDSLTQGLVGYWKLDEVSYSGVLNEVKDSSGQNNNGSSKEAVISAGKFSNAAFFDGANDVIIVNDTKSLSPSKVTVSAWVNIKGYPNNYGRILAKYGSYELIVYGYKGGEGRLEWDVRNPKETDITSGGSVATIKDKLKLNTWYHVAASYDGNTSRVYINGVKVAEKGNIPGSIVDSFQPFTIGGEGYKEGATTKSWWNLNGDIDEVKVYDKALSDTEIEKLYQYTPPLGASTSRSLIEKIQDLIKEIW